MKARRDGLVDVAAASARAQRELAELLDWIRRQGEISDVCTYHILREVCSYCRCERKRKTTGSRVVETSQKHRASR